MVSGMAKTGIVGGVGIVVVVLSATLGWILVPDVLEKVFSRLYCRYVVYNFF